MHLKFILFVVLLLMVAGCMEQSVVDYQVELTAFTVLVEDECVNFQPCWHPAGRTVVYTALSPSKTPFSHLRKDVGFYESGQQIKMVSISGLEKTVLVTDSSGVGSPDFSPDGRQLVYCSKQAGSLDIWKINTETRRQQRLTDHPGDELFPRWSPNGKWIAYMGGGQLIVLTPEGLRLNTIKNSGRPVGTFCWSDDGKQIFYSVGAGTTDDLWRYDLENGTSKKLGVSGVYPSFTLPPERQKSITGPLLAFQRQNDIYQLSMEEETETRIIVSGTMPSWSPDGMRLVYSADGKIKMSTIWVPVDE